MTMVVSAKNGSIVAVTGSGIRHMSDSLIAFQPAIDEPSNIVPSEKMSSSIMLISKVTCCHLPRGSVKRRSTYLTSLSLIDFRTSLAVFMNTPFGYRSSRTGRGRTAANAHYNWGMFNTISECWQVQSDGIQPGFPGPDANGFLDIGHEDFAVADAAGLGCAPDGVDRLLDQVVADHDLDFDLGQEVHDVFRTAIKLGVALLPPKPLGFGDG